MGLQAAPSEPWLPFPGRRFPGLEAHVEDKSHATLSLEWAHHTTNALPAECEHNRQDIITVLIMPIFSSSMCSSGWNAEEPSQDGINPDVLISLTAPKKCAMSFSGKHFLAGRFLPYDIQKKYELNLPEYPGTDCLIEL